MQPENFFLFYQSQVVKKKMQKNLIENISIQKGFLTPLELNLIMIF